MTYKTPKPNIGKRSLNPEFTVEEWDMIENAVRAYDHHAGYRELLDKIMYVRMMEVALPMYEKSSSSGPSTE